MSIKLNFRIDSDHLIVHTLSSMGNDRFSSTKYKKDIVAFQTYAWRKCRPCYNLLVGRSSAIEVANGQLQKTIRHLPKYLNELKKSKQYKKIYHQTEVYLNFCKNQWNDNYLVAKEIVSELIGFKLNKKFNVFITHPSLRNGSYKGDNTIEWGHNEDWFNYTTVYLWHEILHSYFGWSDKEHAIIELIDEELKARLNGKKYPLPEGHKHLKTIKKQLLPTWKKYLSSKKRNIKKLMKETPHRVVNKS